MRHITLIYCEIHRINKNSLISAPPLFPICPSTLKRNSWLTLIILLFSKQLLLLCLFQASQHSYIFYIFINLLYFSPFTFHFLYFQVTLSPCVFSLRLLQNKLLRIFSLFHKIIAYLCKRINVFKKYPSWELFIFWQLLLKNSEFYLFSVIIIIIYLCKKNHAFKECQLQE